MKSQNFGIFFSPYKIEANRSNAGIYGPAVTSRYQILGLFSADEDGGVSLGEADDGVEQGCDGEGYGECLVPVVADDTIYVQQVL